MLDRAEDRQWTVDETHAAALKLRAKYDDGRGRPPLPMFVKSIRRIDRLFVDDDPFGEIEKLEELKDDEVRDLHRAVDGVRQRCEEVEARLNARMARTPS